MATAPSKDELRRLFLEKRQQLTPEKHQELSLAIQERIIKAGMLPKTGAIALYSAVKNEVQTGRLFQKALEMGLHVYFPRVEQGIRFYEVNGPDDLKRGSWNIFEPGPECEELPTERKLDVIFLPGIAFSRHGYRVGYGRGFYDRYLELNRGGVISVGLAYEFQMVEDFAADPTDQKVDLIITEKNTYKTGLATEKGE